MPAACVNAEVRKVGEAAMVAAHGPGPYVALVEYTNIYLTDAARARAEADPAFIQPFVDAVSTMPGVLKVFPSRGLETKRSSSDPIERAAALSHFPGESGDIVVVLKPNWIGTDTSTTTHGSMNAYDQHVPVVFWGAPFKAGPLRDARLSGRSRANARGARQGGDARRRRQGAHDRVQVTLVAVRLAGQVT